MGHGLTMDEVGRLETIPDLGVGKALPATWRSTLTWRSIPQNPWEALAHQSLDPAACNASASLPGAISMPIGESTCSESAKV